MPTAGRRPVFLLLLPLLLVPLCLVAPAKPAAGGSGAAQADAHDALRRFGLPRGLLPDNVVAYTISGDGRFAVELSGPCYAQFSDLAYFEKTVTGRITYGRISGISGIKARKFFVWFSIARVVAGRGGGTVVFDTGYVSETHPAAEFDHIRTCQKAIVSA